MEENFGWRTNLPSPEEKAKDFNIR